MLDFIVDYPRPDHQRQHEYVRNSALMDEEIETHESEAGVPANSLAMVGIRCLAFWYRRGGNVGWFTPGFSRSSGSELGGAGLPMPW